MLIWLFSQAVHRAPSDFRVVTLHKAVWKSATATSGARCVMTSGVLPMLKWPADSWDSRLLVLLLCYLVLFLMALVGSGWTMSSVVGLRQLSSPVHRIHWDLTTVCTLKMLGFGVLQVYGIANYSETCVKWPPLGPQPTGCYTDMVYILNYSMEQSYSLADSVMPSS